jgi:hypothetical protein
VARKQGGGCGMVLGGVTVDDRVVRDLAVLLNQPLRGKLERALLFRAKVVGLSPEEKEAVLVALEHATPDMRELREILMTDTGWRLRERLP